MRPAFISEVVEVQQPRDKESASCEACNYPLQPLATSEAPTASESPVVIRRPARRPRPRPVGGGTSVTLWLFFGIVAAAILVFTGYSSFRKNNQPPVEGSNADQQKLAQRYEAALARDSMDVEANIGLGNILYDTGNWDHAIAHYARAIARDSTRITAIVDMGVCYFNLGQLPLAESLFKLALQREPHQPVALFNLGIVNAHRRDYDTAIEYFHQAMQSNPPPEMQEPLMKQMQDAMQKSGRSAPPLEQGQTPPPGMPPPGTPSSGGK
ncbi:MAG: tetratricopeptide repeat protein [Candidatus Eisenbacteria bacterium]|nr:tetratricopeptide repeat protein [Candidatus Eisenbacteria bacterium]